MKYPPLSVQCSQISPIRIRQEVVNAHARRRVGLSAADKQKHVAPLWQFIWCPEFVVVVVAEHITNTHSK